MGWWKADPVEEKAVSPPQPKPSAIPSNHPPVADGVQQDACPVDQKTREIWLQAAKRQKQESQQQQQQKQQQRSQPQTQSLPITEQTPYQQTQPSRPSSSLQKAECSSDTISQSPTQHSITIPHGKTQRTLSQDRETSTIPRAQPPGLLSSPKTPSNSETETGTSKSGNWIYPSETQFFDAVMRKATTQTSPTDLASSISSIIPIHNAVNERAWQLIKQWEGDSSKSCGGPKLLSFQGLGAGALSPRAKWNTTVMGAKEPFDRHDWTVERCGGEKVEYIIDFYQGKEREDVDPRRRAQELNFYLDVRPKLNTVEGVRMRAERLMGWR